MVEPFLCLSSRLLNLLAGNTVKEQSLDAAEIIFEYIELVGKSLVSFLIIF